MFSPNVIIRLCWNTAVFHRLMEWKWMVFAPSLPLNLNCPALLETIFRCYGIHDTSIKFKRQNLSLLDSYFLSPVLVTPIAPELWKERNTWISQGFGLELKISNRPEVFSHHFMQLTHKNMVVSCSQCL